MKKKILIATLLIVSVVLTGKLYAQDASSKTADYDLKKATKGRVISTDEGALISFNNVKPPRDAASGQASGKRQHKPYYIVKSLDNSVIEASQKDVATFMSPGKKSSEGAISGLTATWSGKPLMVEDGEFTFPPNSPDGEYDLVLSWSWGISNAKMKNGTVKFFAEMKDGACFAIKEQGVK